MFLVSQWFYHLLGAYRTDRDIANTNINKSINISQTVHVESAGRSHEMPIDLSESRA